MRVKFDYSIYKAPSACLYVLATAMAALGTNPILCLQITICDMQTQWPTVIE